MESAPSKLAGLLRGPHSFSVNFLEDQENVLVTRKSETKFLGIDLDFLGTSRSSLGRLLPLSHGAISP